MGRNCDQDFATINEGASRRAEKGDIVFNMLDHVTE
jgi:hypothetical protein